MAGSLHFNIISPAVYFLHIPFFFSTDCMLLIFLKNPNELFILLKKNINCICCLFRIIKENNVNFPILLFCYLIFQIDLTNFEEHIIYIVYLT